VENLANSASFYSMDRIAPSNPEIKHPDIVGAPSAPHPPGPASLNSKMIRDERLLGVQLFHRKRRQRASRAEFFFPTALWMFLRPDLVALWRLVAAFEYFPNLPGQAAS
jgi:hypothetical protein